MSEFIHKSDAQQLVVAKTVAAHTQFLDSTRELRRELQDADVLIRALVMSAGGHIAVSEKCFRLAHDVDLISRKDERHRRWVFEVENPRSVAGSDSKTSGGDSEEWQPIETAPMDGTTVLIASTFRVGESSYEVCLAQQDGYRANKGRPCWRSADGEKIFPGTITHWMPMPKPPEAAR